MADILPLKDAIAAHVADGACVALEGFTHLIPFAAGHELIRQGRSDLHLVRMTPDLVYDQLIGAGAARRLTFSWGGNPGVGSLHRLRDAVENRWPRALELDEHSHAGMAAAYRAGAARLPFGMLRGYIGTDIARQNPRIGRVTCPYTGETLATVPALNPDVTILHAQRAGPGTEPATRSSCPPAGLVTGDADARVVERVLRVRRVVHVRPGHRADVVILLVGEPQGGRDATAEFGVVDPGDDVAEDGAPVPGE
jgi:acyl CoA:acetate/3-ketoacid CoA transferase alpha subunit